MRTVDAVTAPVLAVEPNAVTQSPTANAADDVDWVSVNVVEVPVVILSFCVLTLGAFFFELIVDRLKS
jgi:hypothetical protein